MMSHTSMYFIIQQIPLNKKDQDSTQCMSPSPFTGATSSKGSVPLVQIRPFDSNAARLFCLRQQDVGQLHRALKDMNYILLQSTHHNLRYGCHQNEFQAKSEEYFLKAQAYEEILSFESSTTSNGKVQHLLNRIIEEGNNMMKNLVEEKHLTTFQFQQMRIIRHLVRLDYLYFVLEIREQAEQLEEQQGLVIEPRLISALSPLMPICRYLHRVLLPIYVEQVGQRVMIENGADIIQRLESYHDNDCLRSSTYCVTLHLREVFTSISHTQLKEKLRRFLDEYILDEKSLQGITKDGLLKLTEFVLENQYYLHQNRIYRFIRGGNMSLYYIKLLINIYLYYWLEPLRIRCENKEEIYLRYFNDVFLTWNESKEDLYDVMQYMNNSDTLSLQYDLKMDTKKIHFLDVIIEHDFPTLHTHVAHDWKYEPFILPTLHDSNMITPWNILRMAIIRAVLVCSRLEDFEEEKQYIEYSFLFHQFSFQFIDDHWRRFYEEFQATEMMIYPDQSCYDDLRRKIRYWHQQTKKSTYERLFREQKICIWYIHVPFQGVALYYAKKNPMQYLQYSWPEDRPISDSVHLEIIGVPRYPPNTIG